MVELAGGLWVDSTPRPGFANMAIDQAMLELAEDTGAYLWRLYRWEPFCLSFGQHEPAARRYDRAKIEALGLDVVRRPTGGRAVWHARELTYAVVGPISRLGSLKDAYRLIHDVLATAIGRFVPDVALAASRTIPGLGAGACFASPVGGEVVVDTKKLVGSAQRRGTKALLQHGSLLLQDDQSLLSTLTLGPSPASAETTLSALVGRPVSFDEAAHAVADAAGVPPIGPEGPNEVLRQALLHYDSYRSPERIWER